MRRIHVESLLKSLARPLDTYTPPRRSYELISTRWPNRSILTPKERIDKFQQGGQTQKKRFIVLAFFSRSFRQPVSVKNNTLDFYQGVTCFQSDNNFNLPLLPSDTAPQMSNIKSTGNWKSANSSSSNSHSKITWIGDSYSSVTTSVWAVWAIPSCKIQIIDLGNN